MGLILTAVIYIALGVVIKYGRMYWLIAGYNTMPKEEKEKYDIEGIATLFRNVMFGMAFILVLGYVAKRYFDFPKAEWIAFFVSVLLGIPYLLARANSSKYRKKKE